MAKNRDEMIREYLAKIGSEGGKMRAKRHGKAQLSKWAKLGGRPPRSKKRQTRGKLAANGGTKGERG